jgi:threonine synthase
MADGAVSSLGEGNTPVIQSMRIGFSLGLPRLYFKLESCNPSGSYKDRFSAAEMACIAHTGARSCLATSSGNTGASLAAFCARYNIKCTVVVGQAIPHGKLVQMQAYGAQLLRVTGFDTSPDVGRSVMATLTKFAAEQKVPLIVSSYRHCPQGMRGVESISAELGLQLKDGIDHVFVPVGSGGLFTAVCNGFLRQQGALPKVHAVQPMGCSTVVAAWQRCDDEIRAVVSETRVTGISVSYNIDGDFALRLLRQSKGLGLAVSDQEIFDAQRRLLEEEGVYAEPAGAAALAGLIQVVGQGRINRTDSVVCIVSGAGFKDPDSIARVAEHRPAQWIAPANLMCALSEVTEKCG